jgi:hypothetical protein
MCTHKNKFLRHIKGIQQTQNKEIKERNKDKHVGRSINRGLNKNKENPKQCCEYMPKWTMPKRKTKMILTDQTEATTFF